MMNNDHKHIPQESKAAAICGHIAPSNVNERTFHNVSGFTTTSYSDSQKLNDSVKTQSWESTLETTIKAIVSIKTNQVRYFDTDEAGQCYLNYHTKCVRL